MQRCFCFFLQHDSVHLHRVSNSPVCVCPMRPHCPSGKGFPQKEVGVLFLADDALHLKCVGGGVAGGDHVTLQLPERPLTYKLHSHWSDAAFDPERPVEVAVGLQTCVQLCVCVNKKDKYNC